MLKVRFNTGDAELDRNMGNRPNLGVVFGAVINSYFAATDPYPEYSVLIPSLAEVSPYFSMNDAPSFLIRPYVELGAGLLQLEEFSAEVRETGFIGSKRIYELVEPYYDITLLEDVGEYTRDLASALILYRQHLYEKQLS